MSQIRVNISDFTGARNTQFLVPPSTRACDLAQSAARHFGWPLEHSWWWEIEEDSPQIRYSLYHRWHGKVLFYETLQDAGVTDGDSLVVGPPRLRFDYPDPERVMMLVSGRTFQEVAIVIRFDWQEIHTAFVIPKKLPLTELRDCLSFYVCRRWGSKGDGIRDSELINSTKGAEIDVANKDFVAGDVIDSGDWIIARSPSRTSTGQAVEQDVLDQITVLTTT